MPAELFDPASRPVPAGGGRRLTVTTSIALHAAALAAVVLVPLFGGVSLPSAMSRIDVFVAPPDLPVPPAPQPPAPARPASHAARPDAAPLISPEAIEAERGLPSPGARQSAGAIPIGSGYGIPGAVAQQGAALLPPPPPRVVRPGGDVKPPRRATYVPPVYPPIAQAARVEGTVILEAVIDEAGSVTDVKVLKSVPLLDDAARQAVAKWRYSPTTLNGVPVSVIMTVTVTFALK